MKRLIKNIPFYVKFVFNCEEPERCYSTTDVEALMKIESAFLPGLPLSAVRVGDKLVFKSDSDYPETYEVTGVDVHDIQDDFRRKGSNSRDCIGYFGEKKEALLSIYVTMVLV